jgi:CRISPR-associated protein Cas1
MEYWGCDVKSGDPDNYEARAAAYYWKEAFPQIDNFVRGREELPPNNLLNYGYAILRAVVARSGFRRLITYIRNTSS